MKELKKYSVEIIQDDYQLAAAFNMRYNNHSISNPQLVAHCKQPFFCDVYDKRSIHIGLFKKAKTEKLLIGYCRFVLPNEQVPVFKSLLNQSHSLYKHVDAHAEEERLPFISALPFNKFIVANNRCFLLEQKGKIYFEATTLIIDKKYHSLLLPKFFLSGIYAIAQILNPDHVIITACNNHVNYYKNLGFVPFRYHQADCSFNSAYPVFEINIKEPKAVPTLVRYLKMQFEIEQQMTFELAA